MNYFFPDNHCPRDDGNYLSQECFTLLAHEVIPQGHKESPCNVTKDRENATHQSIAFTVI